MTTRVRRAGAAVALSVALGLGAVAPAHAAEDLPWTGEGLSYPTQLVEDAKLPACQRSGALEFLTPRNFETHQRDLAKYGQTLRSVYGSTFNSPRNFVNSLLYTLVQPLNLVTYTAGDTLSHAGASVGTVLGGFRNC